MQELIENYRQQFAGLDLPVNQLAELRQQGLSRLGEMGFPTTRDENWRYTNIKPLLKQAFNVVTNPETTISNDQVMGFEIENLNSYKVIIVDGRLNTELSEQSLPAGLTLKNLAEVLEQDSERATTYINQLVPQATHGFMELNTAFIKNGVWVEVGENIEIAKPIELLFVSTGLENSLIQPRNVFIAAEQSQVKIIERYVSLSDQKSMTNTISEIYCAENTNVEHIRIQQESRATNHISGTFTKLAQDSHFSTSTITLGGNLTRNDLRCQISGTGAHSNMYGLYAANQRQHVDNFTQVEHQVANCTSDELYKGVLDDRARAVFHGRIYVAQDAQQTDAYQNNRTLLLSRDAEIDTKPQLEIYADDVKCSHGATIGQLNQEYLFYLRARGVEESKARRMLTFAFVKESLNAITIEPLKVYLEQQLDQQLLKGGHYGD